MHKGFKGLQVSWHQKKLSIKLSYRYGCGIVDNGDDRDSLNAALLPRPGKASPRANRLVGSLWVPLTCTCVLGPMIAAAETNAPSSTNSGTVFLDFAMHSIHFVTAGGTPSSHGNGTSCAAFIKSFTSSSDSRAVGVYSRSSNNKYVLLSCEQTILLTQLRA